MYVDGVGGAGPRPSGAHPAASSAPKAQVAPRAELRTRARALVDTVELSKPTQPPTEVDVDPVGLLPQLVVRMTDRLRAAFFDRPEVKGESGPGALGSSEVRPGEGRPSDLRAQGGPTPPPEKAESAAP